MASKCVCDEGAAHPSKRCVYGVTNIFLYSITLSPLECLKG